MTPSRPILTEPRDHFRHDQGYWERTAAEATQVSGLTSGKDGSPPAPPKAGSDSPRSAAEVLSVADLRSYGERMASTESDLPRGFGDLYTSARQARSKVKETAKRTLALQQELTATWQLYQQAWARAERLRELSVSGRRDRLPYSAGARLQAQMATMSVIEQAKGILMAQSGCSPDQAFDLLRRASQHENVKVRVLAARLVANTAQPTELLDSGSQVTKHSVRQIDSAADRGIASQVSRRHLPKRVAAGRQAQRTPTTFDAQPIGS